MTATAPLPTTPLPTTLPTGDRVGENRGLRVTQLRVLRSEWTKFRSLRSTLWTLLIAAVLMVGLGAGIAAITVNQPEGLAPGETAISTSLTGTFIAQLAIGALGVLMITGEYSTGMIRSSLTAVPRRLPVLWAKLVVVAGTVFATLFVAGYAAFAVAQAILSGKHLNVPLTDPAAPRAVLGAALYLTVGAMTGLALGALLRNTAIAITIFVAVFFVIPPLTNLLPAAWTAHFVQYLPSNAGAMMLGGSTYGVVNPLTPVTGFAVMCAPMLILTGLAAWRLRRFDA